LTPSGWQTFVQIGLVLARIRDGTLYKVEFNTFEAYCRVKWQDGRHYVNRLISAAQVFTHLVTISHQQKSPKTGARNSGAALSRPDCRTGAEGLGSRRGKGRRPDNPQRRWSKPLSKSSSRPGPQNPLPANPARTRPNSGS
jgi:hypothetical protein